MAPETQEAPKFDLSIFLYECSLRLAKAKSAMASRESGKPAPISYCLPSDDINWFVDTILENPDHREEIFKTIYDQIYYTAEDLFTINQSIKDAMKPIILEMARRSDGREKTATAEGAVAAATAATNAEIIEAADNEDPGRL